MGLIIKATEDEKDKVISAYLSGMNSKDAAGLYGFCQSSCLKWMKDRGIEHRGMGQSRKYCVNENFFDEIDSEEKAYWLGFFIADGSVAEGRRIVLSLMQSDYMHLYKFRKDICSTHPIKSERSPTPKSRITIDSVAIVKSLATHGVGERKCYVVKPPIIDEALERHFWRGVFDGDGCITTHKTYNGRPDWIVTIAGNKYMVSGFEEFAKKHVATTAKTRKLGKSFQFTLGGNASPRALASVLYSDANVYLDRKYNKYIESTTFVELHRKWGHLTKNVVVETKELCGTWSATAKKIGIPVPTLEKLRKRIGI